MTTVKQIERFLGPFVQDHHEFVVRKFCLYRVPVDRIVRGIFFDRSSEADMFRPRVVFFPLCYAADRLTLSYAPSIYPADGNWRWSRINLRDEFYGAILFQAVPIIEKLRSLDDFASFAKSQDGASITPSFNSMKIWKASVDAARGEFSAARVTCEELLSPAGRWWRNPAWLNDFVRITEGLYPLLLKEDRPAIARLLLSWEAYTVDRIGIRDLWQPTPFPFEASA